MATANGYSSSVIIIDPSELDRPRSNVLKSQTTTPRLLARNLPVFDSLLNSYSSRAQLAVLMQD